MNGETKPEGPMTRKGKKKAQICMTSKEDGKEASRLILIEPLTDQEPCSTVGVTMGYRLSKNYQGVHIDVHVTVPVPPGAETQGIKYAHGIADSFLAKSHAEAQQSLDSLADWQKQGNRG